MNEQLTGITSQINDFSYKYNKKINDVSFFLSIEIKILSNSN